MPKCCKGRPVTGHLTQDVERCRSDRARVVAIISAERPRSGRAIPHNSHSFQRPRVSRAGEPAPIGPELEVCRYKQGAPQPTRIGLGPANSLFFLAPDAVRGTGRPIYRLCPLGKPNEAMALEAPMEAWFPHWRRARTLDRSGDK